MELFKNVSISEESIVQTFGARFESVDFLDLLKDAHMFYEKADLYEVSVRLLRKLVNEHIDLALFVLYYGATSYDELREIVKGFLGVKELFGRHHKVSGLRNEKSFNECRQAKLQPTGDMKPPKKIMVRSVTRKDQVEGKVDRLTDTLADQFAQLILLMKKKTETEVNKSTRAHRDEYGLHNCCYYNKPDHSAANCNEKTHRNTRCRRCWRLGHIEIACWLCSTRYFQIFNQIENHLARARMFRLIRKILLDSLGKVSQRLSLQLREC